MALFFPIYSISVIVDGHRQGMDLHTILFLSDLCSKQLLFSIWKDVRHFSACAHSDKWPFSMHTQKNVLFHVCLSLQIHKGALISLCLCLQNTHLVRKCHAKWAPPQLFAKTVLCLRSSKGISTVQTFIYVDDVTYGDFYVTTYSVLESDMLEQWKI